jgi:hypothetical protein
MASCCAYIFMVYCKPPSLKKKKKEERNVRMDNKNIDRQEAEVFIQELEEEYPKK